MQGVLSLTVVWQFRDFRSTLTATWMLVRHVSKVQVAMEPEFMFVIKTYKPNYSSYIHPRKGHLQDKTINTKWDKHIDTSDRPPSKTYKKNHKFRSTRSSPLPSPPSNNSCKKQRSARWSALKWRLNWEPTTTANFWLTLHRSLLSIWGWSGRKIRSAQLHFFLLFPC